MWLLKKAEDSNKDLEAKIVEFFTTHTPPIDDTDYHNFAEELGIDPHEAEEMVYSILSSILSGGKSKGIRPEGLTDAILEEGMKIESEHSDNPYIQKKIVYDHITELGNDYYSALKDMENSLKGK